MKKQPVALVTGASRKIGIGSSIVKNLAKSHWNIALTYWRPYDNSMPWGSCPEDVSETIAEAEKYGAGIYSTEADLSLPEAPAEIFANVRGELGPVTALILSHCHSVDQNIETATVEEFDLHFAVNARATWLLVREFARQFDGAFGTGRIISITSDHVAHNLPYGASKGAMDRIVLAAAEEYRDRGITSNVINPGTTDTGWMDDDFKKEVEKSIFLKRTGTPQDCASLINFLCSPEGGWINGQLLYSNGGIER